MYACTHPCCTYSGSSLFNLHCHVLQFSVRLEEHGAGKSIAVLEGQVRITVQHKNVGNTMSYMEAALESFHMSHNTDGSERSFLEWAFFIMELFNSSADWYAKKV